MPDGATQGRYVNRTKAKAESTNIPQQTKASESFPHSTKAHKVHPTKAKCLPNAFICPTVLLRAVTSTEPRPKLPPQRCYETASVGHFCTHTVVGQAFPLGFLCLLCILPEAFADCTCVPQLGQAWVNERTTSPLRTRN